MLSHTNHLLFDPIRFVDGHGEEGDLWDEGMEGGVRTFEYWCSQIFVLATVISVVLRLTHTEIEERYPVQGSRNTVDVEVYLYILYIKVNYYEGKQIYFHHRQSISLSIQHFRLFGSTRKTVFFWLKFRILKRREK